MRLSSIVALLVVTASLALGGCAADAESSSKDESFTHSGALATDKPFADSRTATERRSAVEESARTIETAAVGDSRRFDERKPVIGAGEKRLEERPSAVGLALQAEGSTELAKPFDPQLLNGASRMSPEEMAAVVDQHTGASTKP